MLTFYKKYYKTAFDIALILLTVYLFMLLFSFLYRIAAPIFFAFIIFAMIEPFARFLHRRGLKKVIATTISTLLFVLVVLGLLVGAGAIFTSQILNLAEKLPEYQSMFQDQVGSNTEYWQSRIAALPPGVTENVTSLIQKAWAYGSEFASAFLKGMFTGLSTFSSFMAKVLVGTILAFFLSIEIDMWKRLADKHTPNTFKKAFLFLRVNVLAGIAGYLKAQLKLVTVTFVVIFIALLALRVHNAFSIAVLSGVFDLLPLLGVSTVFIPWILYLFIVGNTSLAIWLSALLIAVLGVRQILEPKITGDTLGVSAFTMLSFMIISLSLFGVAGLILSPILIITLKALMEQGYLQKWIRRPSGEYDPSQLR